MSLQVNLNHSTDKFSSRAVLEEDKHKPLVFIFYDNRALFELLEEQIVKKNELRYVSTSDRNDALSLFTNNGPDCMVLMNTTDTNIALEFYDAIIDQSSSLTIPVFFVSGQSKEVINLAYEKGIDEVFPFYLEFDELYLKIKAKIYKHLMMKNTRQTDLVTGLYHESLLQKMYQLQLADVTRLRTPFTLVFVAIKDLNETRQRYGTTVAEQILVHISRYVSTQIRDSDLAFRLDKTYELVILLRHSGNREASFFVTRLLKHVPAVSVDDQEDLNELHVQLAVSTLEIGNASIPYEDAIERGRATLQEVLLIDHSHVEVVEAFREPEVEKIKVSIIESDAVIRNVLLNLLQRMQLHYFEFDIQPFEDGVHFLESAWYQSSHKHIVIIDDVLPKKDGLEILHELRNMPNTEKYIVIMLSTRKADSDLIYAFEMGVDDYITKPFNLKLLESRIKRYIKRLR